MKKLFSVMTILSVFLTFGCGMASKEKGTKTDAPSVPPQIQTEAAPPVIVEKPILPTLAPFDLIVHRVKDIVKIKIKKSVELPEGVNHTLSIKRHKIGEEDAKTQYTVHVDVPATGHPIAVIERQFDGRSTLHIEYPLSRINYDDKGNIIAAQSDNDIVGRDEMLGNYDARTHQQLLRRIVLEQHDYHVKKEEGSWSATLYDAQRKEIWKLRKERRGEKEQIEQEQEQLFASTLYAPEIQAYLKEHDIEWLTPQDITSISAYITISASDQPVEIIEDSDDSE